MARFYSLLVTDIKRDTRASVIVTLEPPANARGDFKFIQGQYLTFRRIFEGEEMRRSYSICAGIDDGFLRIGIKKSRRRLVFKLGERRPKSRRLYRRNEANRQLS